MSDLLIYCHHARQIIGSNGSPLCMSGIRNWCARYEIDFRTFIRDGIPADRFVEIGDHYALMALEIAQTEAANGG